MPFEGNVGDANVGQEDEKPVELEEDLSRRKPMLIPGSCYIEDKNFNDKYCHGTVSNMRTLNQCNSRQCRSYKPEQTQGFQRVDFNYPEFDNYLSYIKVKEAFDKWLTEHNEYKKDAVAYRAFLNDTEDFNICYRHLDPIPFTFSIELSTRKANNVDYGVFSLKAMFLLATKAAQSTDDIKLINEMVDDLKAIEDDVYNNGQYNMASTINDRLKGVLTENKLSSVVKTKLREYMQGTEIIAERERDVYSAENNKQKRKKRKFEPEREDMIDNSDEFSDA